MTPTPQTPEWVEKAAKFCTHQSCVALCENVELVRKEILAEQARIIGMFRKVFGGEDMVGEVVYKDGKRFIHDKSVKEMADRFLEVLDDAIKQIEK